MSLSGQVALVTGGGSGIGRAACLRLAREGAPVVVNDWRGEAADETAALIRAQGREALAIPADVSDSAAVATLFERIGAVWEAPQILVNNAGIATPSRAFQRTTDEEWDRLMAVHLDGTFYCTRAALAGMRARQAGRIVNLASLCAVAGCAGQVAYSAAKGAVVGFSLGVAREVAALGITVNVVAPGLVDTPILLDSGVGTAEARARLTRAIPVGRFGRPEEIAAAIAYLVSPEAAFVTGQVIEPNGGQAIKW